LLPAKQAGPAPLLVIALRVSKGVVARALDDAHPPCGGGHEDATSLEGPFARTTDPRGLGFEAIECG
jgi:hypothetical protein